MIRYTEDAADIDHANELRRNFGVVASSQTNESSSPAQEAEPQKIFVTLPPAVSLPQLALDEEEEYEEEETLLNVPPTNMNIPTTTTTTTTSNNIMNAVLPKTPSTNMITNNTHTNMTTTMNKSRNNIMNNPRHKINHTGTIPTTSQFNKVPRKQAIPRVPLPQQRALPRAMEDEDFPESMGARGAPVVRQSLPRRGRAGLSRVQGGGGNEQQIPLSKKFRQILKQNTPEIQIDETGDVRVERLPQAHPVLGTPPRSTIGPIPSGSSAKKRMHQPYHEVGNNAGRLLSMLRTARGRIRQEWGEMASSSFSSSQRGNLGSRSQQQKLQHEEEEAQETTNLLLKVNRVVDQCSEYSLVSCRVVEKGDENSMTVGDSLLCYFRYPTREESFDDKTLSILKSLGQLSKSSPVESSMVLIIYRPWKVVNYSSNGTRMLICSGLVKQQSST